MAHAPADAAVRGTPTPAHDAWGGLRTLVRARLVVALLALPAGLLLAPGVGLTAVRVLVASLASVGALTIAWTLAIRLRRGRALQVTLQLACDLALVTLLAAASGGRGSQFALFFGVIVVTGGLLQRVPGGLLAAAGAALGYLALPWTAAVMRLPAVAGADPATPLAATLAYLAILGVLAGLLGERVHRAHADLERTTRELDRVRVDNDTVLRHLTTGILSVDIHGRVSYLNPAAEQVLGLRTLECRGRRLDDAFPERLAPLRELVAASLASQSARARAEIEITGPSGRALPLGLSTNVLHHDDRFTGLVAVFQDLSEVRDMERRARRNETLAEIGALSARIAHELRNGLNPISGSVECLQRELNLEGENAVLMELIGRECARLNRFVTDLLSYSRERDLALESLPVDDELAELGELLAHHPRRPAGVTVSVQPGAHEACVRGDREQLKQVWLNLAVNAFDAMATGGRLSVRQRTADGGRVVIEFEDTGTGIAADDLPRVGQPFYTTKQGGTGLGLTIASRIIERHGGTLTLDSAPGRGTTVRVGLPAVESPALARAA